MSLSAGRGWAIHVEVADSRVAAIFANWAKAIQSAIKVMLASQNVVCSDKRIAPKRELLAFLR